MIVTSVLRVALRARVIRRIVSHPHAHRRLVVTSRRPRSRLAWTGSWPEWAAAGLLHICATSLAFGQHAEPGTRQSPVAVPPILALLADGRLVIASAATGYVFRAVELPEQRRPSPILSVGRYLLPNPRTSSVLALLPSSRAGADQIVAVDPRRGSGRFVATLPGDARHINIDLGMMTGRLYAFTSAAAGVVAIDPQSGALLGRWRMPIGLGFTPLEPQLDWRVYQGAVSADEQRVYLSYHGTRTTGIDWFSIRPSGFVRCAHRQRPGDGCIPAHGGLVPLRGGPLLVATGTGSIVLVDTAGMTAATMDTGLRNTHLMQFAFHPSPSMLFAVSSCGVAGGLARVSLKGIITSRETVARPVRPLTSARVVSAASDSVCGERLAVSSSGRYVVVARTAQQFPVVGRPGAVIVLDTRSGKIVKRISTSSEPVDVSFGY